MLRERVQSTLASSPLLFVENVGQFDTEARYQVRLAGGSLWVTGTALWLTLRKDQAADSPASPDMARGGLNIKLSFEGGNPNPGLVPLKRLDSVISYFVGNASDRWRSSVPVYSGIRMENLYEGVSLEIDGTGGRLRFRLVLKDSGNGPAALTLLRQVKLKVEGADSVSVEGNLLQFHTILGIRQLDLFEVVDSQGPVSEAGLEQPATVAGNGTVLMPVRAGRLETAAAPPSVTSSDASQLCYSTFLGGNASDRGVGIAVDQAGNAYVTGSTLSDNFPSTAGVWNTAYNGKVDAFVTKINTNGAGLVYSTFLGGNSVDGGSGITIDSTGNAYVTGYTESDNFPTTANAYDQTYNGSSSMGDVFLTRLNPTGSSLSYSTYLGENGYDSSGGITVDAYGNAYLTGVTGSADFPTTPGAYNRTYQGQNDAFVTKINTNGSGAGSLIYSTFLGGTEPDSGSDIAVDAFGNAYVTGVTGSGSFPTTAGAWKRNLGGSNDAFVAKLNSSGSTLTYSTFLGGSLTEYGRGIAVDQAGNAYVTGDTGSADFPTTAGAYNRTCQGGSDVFLTKLNSEGGGLVYSTFLGGSAADFSKRIVLDTSGNAYITGYTKSGDFPTTEGAWNRSIQGKNDVFVTGLNAGGSQLLYSTFLGGSEDEIGYGLAIDHSGHTYVTGNTKSVNFPTTEGAWGSILLGSEDAFLTKIRVGSSETSLKIYLPCILK